MLLRAHSEVTKKMKPGQFCALCPVWPENECT